MEIVDKAAATMQQVLGPETEELGRTTGVIRRRRNFSAVSLLRMLVLTLLRRPAAKAADFQTTAAQLGLEVTTPAIEHRFTPRLVAFLRAALERAAERALAAGPQPVELLRKFTSVRIGESSTVALPEELADQFPGCGGTLRAGPAAMKIHLLWDFLSGSILRLRITPGRDSDATNPIAQGLPPAGSLSLFDLGYFALDRFRNIARAGAFWISRLQFGTSVFDAQGQPLALLQYLRGQTGPGPIDVSVLLGVADRLPCRLIALRVPQEVADRRRQKAYEKARKHGRVPSREYLDWQDWTIFVTNCEPGLLSWQAVVVLYRARWQIELMFKLWKSHNRLATHRAGASAEEQMAVVYAKLIAVLVQHWLLLSVTWSASRRSLMKAAAIIADWVTLLIDALDDRDRLVAILSRMADVLLRSGARVQNRNVHPSLSQLLQDPILLDYKP
jgi:Transposase DDE domain